MTIRLKFEYRYCRDLMHSKRHQWTAVGRAGGVHFHVREYDKDWIETYGAGERFSAGLEFHSTAPPTDHEHDAPDHNPCWLLKGPCWHDGTSLYAIDDLVPFWQADPQDHDRMFERLEMEYVQHFMQESDE